jgi:lipopolysaccharide export system permease protein
MNLLSRYLLGRFLKTFLFVFALVLILAFLFDAFDRMNLLLHQSAAPFHILLEYLWLNVPFWAVKALPVTTLLATLFVAVGFIRSGEWLAAQASGFKPSELARPFFIGAAIVTAGTFLAQETVLPFARDRADTLYNQRIYTSRNAIGQWHDILVVTGPGTFLMARNFDTKKGRMERVVMDEYKDGRLRRQWDSRAVQWDANLAFWVFENGMMREFGAKGQPVREKEFLTEVSELRTPPKDLVPQQWDPDRMGLREILRHIRRLHRLGMSEHLARTAFHLKLAYPFANLVMCALAIPFAFRSRRTGRTAQLAGALGLAFSFWCVLLVGQALGEAGLLPGLIAAWSANLVFTCLAFYLYRRTEGLGA